MATRDYMTKPLNCPGCKAKGQIHISDDDHAFGKASHREIEGVDGDFDARISGHFGEIKITCKKCNTRFPLYSKTA